ncbi:MAG: hypothetical protein GDYSWBUE_000668 [Candidatus Fervidibacterota bacterium]
MAFTHHSKGASQSAALGNAPCDGEAAAERLRSATAALHAPWAVVKMDKVRGHALMR